MTTNTPETYQEPAIRCTTVLGNEAVLKLRNIEEMTYNPAAKIVQIFTHHQHLIVAMSRDEFEALFQATTTLKMHEEE